MGEFKMKKKNFVLIIICFLTLTTGDCVLYRHTQIDTNTSADWSIVISGLGTPNEINLAQNLPAELINILLDPSIGTSSTIFTYQITYKDSDNNPPEFGVVRLYIDGDWVAMWETNASDTYYVDGKDYYYQTTLSLGNHQYFFSVSDGFSVTTSSLMDAPSVESITKENHLDDDDHNNDGDNNTALILAISGISLSSISLIHLFRVKYRKSRPII